MFTILAQIGAERQNAAAWQLHWQHHWRLHACAKLVEAILSLMPKCLQCHCQRKPAKLTELTMPSWPRNFRNVRPVATSHTKIWRSPPPLTSLQPGMRQDFISQPNSRLSEANRWWWTHHDCKSLWWKISKPGRQGYKASNSRGGVAKSMNSSAQLSELNCKITSSTAAV